MNLNSYDAKGGKLKDLLNNEKIKMYGSAKKE
jgi:hypothetical protein